ncbi:MAG: hypothetical protein MI742_07325 [Desulfobacterales bacterium]|nr:hypothetical protein [Desulfobacterales bacterium]
MGTLKCRLELSKKGGLTITAEDPDEKLIQSIVMDGKSITLKVKGKKTSTVIMTHDKIEVSCKSLDVKAETITFASEKESVFESKESFEIKGKTFALEAQKDAEVSAENATIKSSSATDISGQSLALEGKESAEVKAATVSLDAQGSLDLKASGVANLEGSNTNIGGTVKLG